MNNLEEIKTEWTSLELVDQINYFRNLEGNRSKLRHNDLLKVIRDEFEDEIHAGNISQMFQDVKIGNGATRKSPIFILTNSQAKQVLVRESKFVRRAVIKKIEQLEMALLEESKYIDLPQIEVTDKPSRKKLKMDILTSVMAVLEVNKAPEHQKKVWFNNLTKQLGLNGVMALEAEKEKEKEETMKVTLEFPIKRSIEIKGK